MGGKYSQGSITDKAITTDISYPELGICPCEKVTNTYACYNHLHYQPGRNVPNSSVLAVYTYGTQIQTVQLR